MIKLPKIATLIGTLFASVTFSSIAVAAPQTNQPIAREAGETRGEGPRHPAIEIKDQLARHGADDPTEDIGDDHGGRHSTIPANQLARHGADDPTEDIGDDHGGRHSTLPVDQLARHGADDPTEDIGDDHGGRRG